MPNSNTQAPMYIPAPEGMEEDEEEIAGAGEESIDNPPNMHFEDGNVTGATGVEEVVPHMGGYVSGGPDYAMVAGNSSGSPDQLTLSFHGEVYVFDSVSPEKVQAVLLLLGGYEIPSAIPTMGTTSNSQRAINDLTARSLQPHRAASLNRFREKRKERCFEKKIRYNVRQEVALRMQRKKGQFTSTKVNDEMGSAPSGPQGSGQDDSTLETLCTHCGISSKSTPMMRRGPAGPRTLCNACGLKWANKGMLRDLSKVSTSSSQDPAAKATNQIGNKAHGVGAVTMPTDIVPSSNSDNSAVINK